MPLVRAGAKLIYFAHVPKCAGTALERYLEARFGAVALWDRKFGALEETERWSTSSPQHMPEAARARLIPDDFIDASFAVVRHPLDRLKSVFLFQREIEQSIPAGQSFSAWLEGLEDRLAQTPSLFDNHILPMVQMVPEGAVIFQLEQGLTPFVTWLDGLTGDTSDVEIVQANVTQDRLTHSGRGEVSVEVTQRDAQIIQRIYAQDYARFGYQPNRATAV